MKRKLLFALFLALVLSAGALCHAQSYGSVAARINFYYQHDGGERNQPGIWDVLLRDRLRAISGHDTIYYDSSTDKYLTGRGCCLFSFAHAYQYLTGYAASTSRKADILYQFLSIKSVWSNKGTSLSPPNGHTYYAAYLAKQSGVSKYSGDLSSFSKLVDFFEGGKGVIIVNAPGHYIIAVGARKYGGTQYVQVVDSIMSATVRDSRLSYGKSMDFSVTYTQQNAAAYEAAVHEYWLPYSEFAEKCKLKYAFRSGSAPRENRFRLVKDQILLPEGHSYTLALEGASDLLSYESLQPDVCQVDAMGELVWKSEGQATIRVTSPDNPQNVAWAQVYCVRLPEDPLVIAKAGGAVPAPVDLTDFPAGAELLYQSATPAETGLYSMPYTLLDAFGDAVAVEQYRLAAVEEGRALTIPSSVRILESGAFEETPFTCVCLPWTVTRVESGAFDSSAVRLVLAACDESAVESGAFPEGAQILFDREAVEAWLAER